MSDDLDNPPPSFSAGRKFGTGFGVLVAVAAFLAIVVMVNFLATRHFHRVVLSEDRVPPLAPVTLNLLRGLTNDLTVTLYFDPDETLYTHILQTLRQYPGGKTLRRPGLSVHRVQWPGDQDRFPTSWRGHR